MTKGLATCGGCGHLRIVHGPDHKHRGACRLCDCAEYVAPPKRRPAAWPPARAHVHRVAGVVDWKTRGWA